MTECPSCGAEILDATAACEHCGSSLVSDEWVAFCSRIARTPENLRWVELSQLSPEQRQAFDFAWEALGWADRFDSDSPSTGQKLLRWLRSQLLSILFAASLFYLVLLVVRLFSPGKFNAFLRGWDLPPWGMLLLLTVLWALWSLFWGSVTAVRGARRKAGADRPIRRALDRLEKFDNREYAERASGSRKLTKEEAAEARGSLSDETRKLLDRVAGSPGPNDILIPTYHYGLGLPGEFQFRNRDIVPGDFSFATLEGEELVFRKCVAETYETAGSWGDELARIPIASVSRVWVLPDVVAGKVRAYAWDRVNRWWLRAQGNIYDWRVDKTVEVVAYLCIDYIDPEGVELRGVFAFPSRCRMGMAARYALWNIGRATRLAAGVAEHLLDWEADDLDELTEAIGSATGYAGKALRLVRILSTDDDGLATAKTSANMLAAVFQHEPEFELLLPEDAVTEETEAGEAELPSPQPEEELSGDVLRDKRRLERELRPFKRKLEAHLQLRGLGIRFAVAATLFLLISALTLGDRYVDQGDGTVLDTHTRLIWLKDATCAELSQGAFGGSWHVAQTATAALADGSCGLTDGSAPGDWRLPEIDEFCGGRELAIPSPLPCRDRWDSLIRGTLPDPPKVTNASGDGGWSEGDAFVGVQATYFWSATELADYVDYVFVADLDGAFTGPAAKRDTAYAWPVRRDRPPS